MSTLLSGEMRRSVDASLLPFALTELSTRSVGACTSAVSALDLAAQEQLSRQDEIAALVDAARLDVQYTTDVAFAKVYEQSKVRPKKVSSPTNPFFFLSTHFTCLLTTPLLPFPIHPFPLPPCLIGTRISLCCHRCSWRFN